MPWEKSFDLEQATEKAMMLFWRKGFEAASMAELTKAMNINKGSLYNAFSCKDDLFKHTLLQYDEVVTKTTLARVQDIKNPQKALKILFDSIIKDTNDDKDNKGCFIVNTTLELPRHNAEIQKIVRTSLANTEMFFTRLTERGQSLGMFPKNLNAKQTGSALLAFMIAIRLLSRGVYTQASLDNIRTQALKLVSA